MKDLFTTEARTLGNQMVPDNTPEQASRALIILIGAAAEIAVRLSDELDLGKQISPAARADYQAMTVDLMPLYDAAMAGPVKPGGEAA